MVCERGDQPYNRGARALHWAIALLVIANLATGFFHDALESTVNVMPFHKASGLTILLLSLARAAWRTPWTRPPYPDTVDRTEVMITSTVQWLFSVFMIAMPLTYFGRASSTMRPKIGSSRSADSCREAGTWLSTSRPTSSRNYELSWMRSRYRW